MSLREVMDKPSTRIAADIGGTFTDIAAFDETTGELRLGKTLTTPKKLVDGIIGGVEKAGAKIMPIPVPTSTQEFAGPRQS